MMSFRKLSGRLLGCFLGILLAYSSVGRAQQATAYKQTNIISNGAVPALVTDPNFVDPWGISIGPAFWMNTAVTGFDYVTDASGNIQFKATIPSASGTGTGSPTGTVFVTGAPAGSFMLSNGSAQFLFCSLDGTISGWNTNSAGNVTEIKVNRSANKAVYTGMALLTNNNGTFILAANFGQGHSVEVYDTAFHTVALSGPFTDPNLPAGYAPYGIHVIGTNVYVTYMLRDATTFQETLGAGTGLVDVFDVNGQFVKRAITGGNLNAPWGMALAPAGFGQFGGDLLVGNFGDGVINVYNPTTYDLLGQLTDANGNVISNPGLWEILFGQANPSVGDPNTLYFDAGLNQERDGLFGSIAVVSTNGNGNFALHSSSGTLTVTRGQSATATLTLSPSNGFTGPVTLACSGLPPGAACAFSQSPVNLTGANAQVTLTISAGATYTPPPSGYIAKTAAPHGRDLGIAMAAMMPFAGFFLFGAGRRRRLLALLPVMLLGLVVAAGVAGCGGKTGASGPVSTPTGTSQVTVTATSGAISQTATISLTVQ